MGLLKPKDRCRLRCSRRADDFGQRQPTPHRCKCAAGEFCAGRINGFHGLAVSGRGGSGRLMPDRSNFALAPFIPMPQNTISDGCPEKF